MTEKITTIRELLARLCEKLKHDGWHLTEKKDWILVSIYRWKYFPVDNRWEMDTRRAARKEDQLDQYIEQLNQELSDREKI